jgi:hypothetical protein
MNKYSIYVLLALLWISMPLSAESTASEFIHGCHAIRLGWGDAAIPASLYDFEGLYSIIYDLYGSPYGNIDEALQYIQGMPAPEADDFLRNYRVVETGKMHTSGHLFLGYRYQFTPVVSFGADVDMLYMHRENKVYNGYMSHLTSGYGSHKYENLCHLTLMPTVRFTYFRQRVLELYSALGVGYSLYLFKKSPAHGMSLNATLLGVNVGNEHWYAEAEIGSMQSWAFSFPGTHGLYGSRLLSVAVGYRF